MHKEMGAQDAAAYVGGDAHKHQQYDGSCWSEKTYMTNNRISGSAAGITTSLLTFGGYDSGYGPPTNTPNVEKWDGSSWTEVANIATPRTNTAGSGSTSNAIMNGGYPGYVQTTEEWADPVYAIKTVTVS